jgi:hypothetical protein
MEDQQQFYQAQQNPDYEGQEGYAEEQQNDMDGKLLS